MRSFYANITVQYLIYVLILKATFWNKIHTKIKLSYIKIHVCACQIKNELSCGIILRRKYIQHITLSNTFFLLLQCINILLGCPTPDYYDENCSLSCSPHCINSRCHIETGHCFGCKDGYQGQMCEQRMYFCDHTWTFKFWFQLTLNELFIMKQRKIKSYHRDD